MVEVHNCTVYPKQYTTSSALQRSIILTAKSMTSQMLNLSFLLERVWCRWTGQREEEKRGGGVISAPLRGAGFSAGWLSPGTAVAPGCLQFRGWAVCAVTVCHLCLRWQVGFGIHCATFSLHPRSMFRTLKRAASAERSA